MKAFIHYIGDRPFSPDCESAERGFEELGIECVRFSNDVDLSHAKAEDIVVAGMLVTEGRLSALGASPDPIEYPKRLGAYLGRDVWLSTADQLIADSRWPVFVKPVKEKLLKGQIVQSREDLSKHQEIDRDMKLWCSDVLHLDSEWRCYVKDGQILGVVPYVQNDPASVCDEMTIRSAVLDLGLHPAGCSLDFGVTSEGATVLIEANDGYALGNYGLDDDLYASLLLARWEELVSQVSHEFSSA